ncbi:hypothetical protein [Streptomyces sp. NPDC051569]|uniref:hypothetical protein n=1 Tax=Streptomyces sp. NPDC051569 TaxID=3365661 RepID=UPI00379FDCD1
MAEALTRKLRRPVTVAEIGLGPDGSTDLMVSPVAAASDLGRLIVHNRRDFLALAFSTSAVLFPLTFDRQAAATTLRSAGSGRRVGPDEVATVRQFTETFRAADERLGGGHGLAVVAVFLSDVVSPMLNGAFPNDQVRRGAFEAAAALATLVGWKCHDFGREGAAQRFYQLAYRFACESDPAGHAAWAMRALVHQAIDVRQPAGTVELAEAALVRAGPSRPAYRSASAHRGCPGPRGKRQRPGSRRFDPCRRGRRARRHRQPSRLRGSRGAGRRGRLLSHRSDPVGDG